MAKRYPGASRQVSDGPDSDARPRPCSDGGTGPVERRELILGGRRYRLVPVEKPLECQAQDQPAQGAPAGLPPPARTSTGLLTARELQVVVLVAEGRVNKQVADTLRISEWTVSTHLRRIFAKLGVDTRAAMVSRCLPYGILVRNLGTGCDSLVTEVLDVRGNTVSSGRIAVPRSSAIDELVDFEDRAMPPRGWTAVTTPTGSGMTVANRAAGAHGGRRGMMARDVSTPETASRRAAIERTLPVGRSEWLGEGWFKPTRLDLGAGQGLYLLHFLSVAGAGVAAGVLRNGTTYRAGLAIGRPGAKHASTVSGVEITVDSWRKWTLRLRRLGTREATAILEVDGSEALRVGWDASVFRLDTFRAGIASAPLGTASRLLADEIRVASPDDR